MQEYKYRIGYNDSINRWWISDMGREAYEAPYETFDAEVNLGEAYVQIVYPVRREFLKEDRIAKVGYYEGNYSRVYFPFENNRVDFTTFIHTPHYIYVNALTHLYVEEAGNYPFELYTCGGMKLWVNREEITCFAPYTRNIPGKTLVWLPLQKGLNEITVYADELAERDVFFYYELRYKGSQEITGVILLDTDVNEVERLESFLKSCYFPKDVVTEGRLILKVNPSLLLKKTSVYVTGDDEAAKLNNVKLGNAREIVVDHNTSEIDLGRIYDYNVGMFRIFVLCKSGEFVIKRDLVVGVMPKELVTREAPGTLRERKLKALDFICNYGENVINRTMAILECRKEMTPEAYDCMLISLRKIEAKEDCADFYLSPMYLLMTRYREYLSDDLYERMKQSVLNFRYWIDEPGNDVMWYFSENHALLFHIGQYLAGYLFPEDTFTVSGRKGREQYEIGKQRVENWFKTFEKYGYAEWNSATYIPVDLIGFFILYLMAPDSSIKDAVKRALDFTFKIIAYNSHSGIMCSSYGRAYEETLKGRQLLEPNFLSWISYGEGFLTSASRAASLYCLSDYNPGAYQEEVRLGDREWMTAELDQGINKVKTYFFKTNDCFMASVRRFKPFVHGHQQHLMNVALGSKGVQYFINHPGERPFSGGNRPAYWAGNGTIPYIEQYRNLMIILYKIDPEELVHYIHAYTPFYEYDEYLITKNWLFLRVEDAYLGTYFSNGVEPVVQGANSGKEVISQGLHHGIIVKVGSKKEYGDFSCFTAALSGMSVLYDGDEKISFYDPQYGRLEINGIHDVKVGGISLEYTDTSAMKVTRGTI